MADAIASNLASKLGGQGMPEENFAAIFADVMTEEPGIAYAAACDLTRYVEIDPAADGHLSVFCFFKGFQAVQCARIAHHLWVAGDAQSRLIARCASCFQGRPWHLPAPWLATAWPGLGFGPRTGKNTAHQPKTPAAGPMLAGSGGWGLRAARGWAEH